MFTETRDTNNPVRVGNYECGIDCQLLVIAGPCVIQDESITVEIAERLKTICDRLPVNLVFKASFDKANRTSVNSFRGPGIHDGLRILSSIGQQFELPVTTDIHEAHQAAAVGEVCELIQIPAFLARQTDLLEAAAKTGRTVNVKKGQFMAPSDMIHVRSKLNEFGCADVMLTERGTFFGYGQLVNDMRSLVVMKQLGVPVVFDATHSVQQPSGLDGTTGGQREMVAPLARAAMAVGIDAIFLETHPNPELSPSDGPNMVPMNEFEDLLQSLLKIRDACSKQTTDHI